MTTESEDKGGATADEAEVEKAEDKPAAVEKQAEAKPAAKESSPGKKKKKKKAAHAVSAPPAEAPAKKPAHGHAHAAAAHGPHHHVPDRRQYLVIFLALFVLTVLEVGVAYLYEHIGKLALVTALVGLALTKAGAVALYYMHLKHETRWMRWTVGLPMLFPALYAFILIAEGMYRALWGGS
jgi:cytochrome c oxidase subunit 4